MAGAKGTILVTGANGGLGSAIVQQIASDATLSVYHGLYTVRDVNSSSSLISALAGKRISHPHDYISLDLTQLDDVRRVAEDVNNRVSAGQIPPLRALILNAGFQDFGKQSWTDDGFDVTFAANYLGHWLLTLLLLKSVDKEAGRIIVIGSQSHDPDDPRNAITKAFEEERFKTFVHDRAAFEDIAKGTWSSAKEDPSFRGGFRRYGAAKLFLIMMMHELQRRTGREKALQNICVLGVDPGAMITGHQRLSPWFIRVLMFQLIYPSILWLKPNNQHVRSTSCSASDVLEAAFSSASGNLPKDLYFDGTKPLETSSESRDDEKRRLVWEWTVEMTGLREGDTVLADWQ